MASQSSIGIVARNIQRGLVSRGALKQSTTFPAVSRLAFAAGQFNDVITSIPTSRFFTVNGYNHDGPRGKHITPHNPTENKEDKKDKDKEPSPPPPPPKMPHDNQKGRTENPGSSYASDGGRRNASTAAHAANNDDSEPVVDIRDETDVEEMGKIQNSEEVRGVFEAKRKAAERSAQGNPDFRIEGQTKTIDVQDESDAEELRKQNAERPVTATGRTTTNGPNPVVDIRDQGETIFQEGKDKAKTFVDQTKEYAGEASQEAKEKAEHAKEFVEEKSHDGMDKAKTFVDDAKEYMSEAREKSEHAKEYVTEAAQEVKVKAEHAKEYMEEKSQEASKMANDTKDFLGEKSNEAEVHFKEGKNYVNEKSQEAKSKADEAKEYLNHVSSRAQEKIQPMVDSAKETYKSVMESMGTLEKPIDYKQESVESSRENDIRKKEFDNGENGRSRTNVENSQKTT